MRSDEKITTAVILAAGKGSRLYPYTKTAAKELLPLNRYPAIYWIVKEAADAGIRKFVVVISPRKIGIKNLLLSYPFNGCTIEFVYQISPRGPAHALLSAEKSIDGNAFAVLYGDDIWIPSASRTKALVDTYEKLGSNIISAKRVKADEPYFGVIEGKKVAPKLSKIGKIVERKPARRRGNWLVTHPGFILSKNIFPLVKSYVKRRKNGEIFFNPILNGLVQKENSFALELTGKGFDIGTWDGYAKASRYFEKVIKT